MIYFFKTLIYSLNMNRTKKIKNMKDNILKKNKKDSKIQKNKT